MEFCGFVYISWFIHFYFIYIEKKSLNHFFTLSINYLILGFTDLNRSHSVKPLVSPLCCLVTQSPTLHIALTAADLAAKFEIRIYTIGAGTNQDVSFIPGRGYIRNEIDEETLKSISKRTNGQYFRATNISGLEQIYDTIDTLERTEIEIKEFTQYKELFGWFLIPALILGLTVQTLDRTLFRRKI